MRTILILNPASGASMLASHEHSLEENEEAIVAALRAAGIEPEIWPTTPEENGYGLAQKAAHEGAEMVIAAGGDGTLHAVASGLIGTKSTLGIIPMGTMNNIAHSLEIPAEVEKACAIIAQGETCHIDVGKVNDHIFLEVAGIGLEAALFPAAEEFKSPGLLSSVRGAVKGLFTLLAFRPTRYRAAFDGHQGRSFRAVQVSICNSPYYGANFRFAPNAVMNDGLLDVLIYKNFSTLEYLRHAFSISQGQRPLGLKVTRRKIKSLHIAADEPAEVHADGAPIGHTPVTITIEPGVLRVRVSEKIASGSSVVSGTRKQTRHYQRASSNKILVEKEQVTSGSYAASSTKQHTRQ